MACTINPSLELENEDTISQAEEKKKILVIGGGPAGMEAAYTAKKRGHHVVLCEKEESLGGLMRIAAVPIAKQDLARVIQYMSRKLEKAGVEVRLNCTVTKEMLQQEFADYEVIAGTGASPIVIQPFTAFKQWMTADDILAGRSFPRRKVVIIGGGSVGCETADYLAPLVHDLFPRNREITVLEMAGGVMLGESGPGRSLLVQRMMKKGVEMICNAKVEKVDAENIYCTKGGQEYCISGADTLVFAVGYRNHPDTEEMLKECGMTYHMIGDAKKTGNIKDAITEGYQTAKGL